MKRLSGSFLSYINRQLKRNKSVQRPIVYIIVKLSITLDPEDDVYIPVMLLTLTMQIQYIDEGYRSMNIVNINLHGPMNRIYLINARTL